MVSYKTQTVKPIAARSAGAVLATVALFATVTYKHAAAPKQVVAAVSADSSVTTICRRLAVRARTGLPHLPVAPANAGLFKIPINKPIAARHRAEDKANVALSTTAIYKPCAEQKRAEVAASAALSVTAICNWLAEQKPDKTAQYKEKTRLKGAFFLMFWRKL